MVTSMGSAGGSAAERAQRNRDKADRLRQQAEQWERGSHGEQIVGDILSTLSSDFVVLHDIDIPGSNANVDHLVIGPTGVFAIDSKNWNATLTAGKGTLWRGRFPIRKECATASWEASEIADVLGHAVRPLLCFVGTGLPHPRQDCDDVVVCADGALISVLVDRPVKLVGEQINGLVERVRHLLRQSAGPSVAARDRRPVGSKKATTNATRSPRRSVPSRALRLTAIALATLTALLTIPFATKLIASSFQKSMKSATPPLVVSTSSAPAESPATTVAPQADATTTTAPFAPPTITFTCPTPAGGWIATVTPVEFRADPDGFQMWYLDANGNWTYWGLYKSGGAALNSIGPIDSSRVLQVKAGRETVLDVDSATVQMFPAPSDRC